MELPNKKYNIIYADPPWSYGAWSDKSSGNGLAAKHYKTMTNQDICELKVEDLAEKDCVLFMWVTYPHLQTGLDVIKAWGFTFKTVAFTWVKRHKNNEYCKGLGYWTRSNAEICLLAVKGSPNKFVIDRSVSQIIDTVREKHSKKPDVVRDRIVQLLGDLPRIELFARQTADGWDSWGNEVS